MATGTVLSVCNRALLAIGSRVQISDLNEGSTQANACNLLFQPTFEQLARAAYWNCLRQQKTLTLLAAAPGTPENTDGTALPYPPNPWLYSYTLPSDNLQARFIIPTFPPQGSGQNPPISPAMIGAPCFIPDQSIPFRVAIDSTDNIPIVLTNQSQAQLVYTVNQPNPQLWDSMFQGAMVASLAAYLVPALNLNMTLMQIQVKIAENIISQARVRDGDEGTTSQDHIPDFIRARDVGAGPYGSYGSTYGGWQDMCWGYV